MGWLTAQLDAIAHLTELSQWPHRNGRQSEIRFGGKSPAWCRESFVRALVVCGLTYGCIPAGYSMERRTEVGVDGLTGSEWYASYARSTNDAGDLKPGSGAGFVWLGWVRFAF